MLDANITKPSLLMRIRSAEDAAAWSQFVDVYAPLIYGFARKHNLQDADAADLTQEVLRAIARSVHRLDYDPRHGSFRGWLFTVVRNKLHDHRASRARRMQGSGDTAAQIWLQQLPDPTPDQSAEWELEHQRRLFAWAAEQVQQTISNSTWQAFWQTAVEGRNGAEVASDLGLTVAAVYLAKGRVMARMKKLIEQLESESPAKAKCTTL
jgi:RNA polymerase sigma factor (sigma-70 family)